jgi:hypothetical protein
MKTLKERNPILLKLLAVLLLVLLCCNLPSLLFWPLCLKEDFFRPSNTEVLVSACKRPVAIGVPDGEVLFVREGNTDKMYLLDLRTGEKRKVPDDPFLLDHGIFLSSELVWLEGSKFSQPESPGYKPHYILDLTDGRRYEMLNLNLLPRLEGGKFDPKYYSYFQSAEQVFIHHSKYTLIALSSDFRQHPERNVVFSKTPSGNFKNGEVLRQLMNNLGVDYEIVDFSLQYADVPSPTGKYVVRNDGIYLSKTNMPVVTRGMEHYFRGWYSDESGVVVQGVGYSLITLPGTSSFYYIPTPILKLRLPAP